MDAQVHESTPGEILEPKVQTTPQEPAVSSEKETEHGSFYWTFVHLKQDTGAFLRRHLRKLILMSVVLVAGLVLFRPAVHPFVMVARSHLLLVLTWALALGLAGRLLFAHRTWGRKTARILFAGMLLGVMWMWSAPAYQYLSHYARHAMLSEVPLSQWPISDHERLQPYKSVVNIVLGKLGRTQDQIGLPNIVRVNKRFDWTTSVGPKYWYGLDGQMFGYVGGVIDIDATVATPDWTNLIPVHFDTGDELWLSHNLHTCVVRAFGPWQYFNYEPAEVKFMLDDNKKWVEVVTLIKWGWLGYQPEFGGVLVVPQMEAAMLTFDPAKFLNWFTMMTRGCGTWIPPEEVHNHPFLVGQNLVPEAVTRYTAESFSFRAGFLGPLTHDDDIEIPKLPDDYNDMPYVAFFKGIASEQDKLYHNFLLEPRDPIKHGLSLALFIPGDRGEPVYTYHEVGLTGPAAPSVTSSIRDSNQVINWNTSHPVERRLWIRQCGGKPQPFYLTNIVSQGEEGKGSASDVGSHITLTGMGKSPRTIWVDAQKPDTWLAQVQKEFPDECPAKQP